MIIYEILDELHIALVKSTCAHAKIIDINAEDALSVDGVLDFLCYKDVPGQNRNSSMIPDIKDEEAFAEETVPVFYYYNFCCVLYK